tara:strand:+ start:293 stop:661 length:369 start_codon:yes stop_codon:yes gene_type:complete
MRIIALNLSNLILLSLTGAQAQDLKKGLQAYKSGDYATAIKEWRPLAEAGDPGAQYNLGFNYVQGKGIAKDLVQAYFWFGLAARQGRGIATQLRDGISKSITPEQLQEARAKVTAWVKRKAN